MAENHLEQFIEKVAFPCISETLKTFVVDFDSKKEDLKTSYIASLTETFQKVQEFTKQTNKPIDCLAFTLSRTNLLYGRSVYDIHIYDEAWYMKNYIKVGELDVSYFFQPLEVAKKHIQAEGKKYVGKIDASDIDNIISLSFEPFSHFFIKIFRYSMPDVVESDAYKGIAKSNDFTIYTGEMYETVHTLYRENKKRMDFNQLLAYLDLEEFCENLDLRKSNFIEVELANANLPCADFSESVLKNIDFSNAMLEGALFVNCDLTYTIFRGAELAEANFLNADLRNSDLSDIFVICGKNESSEGDLSYYLPVNFQGADLRKATIENAVLDGVDFTNTQVEDISFENTDLSRCKFKSMQLQQLKLTEIQRSQIVVV